MRVLAKIVCSAALIALASVLFDPLDVVCKPVPDKSQKSKTEAPTLDLLAKPMALTAGGVTFQIRPPLGYKLIEQDGPFTKAFGWQGAVRTDGTCASFMVSIITAPEGEAIPPLEKAISSMVQAIKARREKWQQQPMQYFSLNGRQFGRMYWDCVEPTRQLDMRGYEYGTIAGRNIFIFASQDIKPLDEQTLPIGERSIESFKLSP